MHSSLLQLPSLLSAVNNILICNVHVTLNIMAMAGVSNEPYQRFPQFIKLKDKTRL